MRYALTLAVIIGCSFLAFRLIKRRKEPKRVDRILDRVADGLDRASVAAEQARRIADQGRVVASELRR
ncbi:MAG: hypothetical protein GEU80_10385 [Dehalococcoidia bacterium]|nr:hypothetical protein [Dehalococcoidia bacterium]